MYTYICNLRNQPLAQSKLTRRQKRREAGISAVAAWVESCALGAGAVSVVSDIGEFFFAYMLLPMLFNVLIPNMMFFMVQMTIKPQTPTPLWDFPPPKTPGSQHFPLG